MTIKTIIDADGSVTTTDDGSEGGEASTTIVRADGSVKTIEGDGHPIPTGPSIGASMTLARGRDDRHDGFDPGSFFAGMFLAALIAMCLSVWRSRRAGETTRRTGAKAEPDRMAADVAALARRTAALETIVTDPGHRTAREIDALR